ncbi:hypothetical protein ACRWQL_01085 [Shewanella sp. HL-SH4]|uniref:hypothetical protein n=1 Tax=Shewanella sp. HL-SH4 TaxID=3436240 RepID=UPI003EBD7284
MFVPGKDYDIKNKTPVTIFDSNMFVPGKDYDIKNKTPVTIFDSNMFVPGKDYDINSHNADYAKEPPLLKF